MNKELWTILPETLQETFADTTARMVTESLCLFYVALTLARHSLLLLTQPITAQKIPSTFAGLLLATLTDQSQAGESQLLYEAGDPDWFLHLPQMSAAPAIPAAPQTTTQLPAIRLAKPLPCRERGLPRRTPSQHDRGSRGWGWGAHEFCGGCGCRGDHRQWGRSSSAHRPWSSPKRCLKSRRAAD